MNVRVKIILVSILLGLALSGTVLAAASTVQAFHTFQQQRALMRVGDVNTIRSWMTIPYIAHVYHVPESELLSALRLPAVSPIRHVTLTTLATRIHQPLVVVIHTVQKTIVSYRHTHPLPRSTPTPSPATSHRQKTTRSSRLEGNAI